MNLSPPPYRPFGGLRLLLAVMVLLQHGLLLLPEHARAAFYGLELGAVAVTVFFVLSGYVVAEAVVHVYAGRPALFLANRGLRIIPLYVVALTLTASLDCWFYARDALVPLDAQLQGPPWSGRALLAGLLDIVPGLPSHWISGQDFSFIPFAWTLRIEGVFYLAASIGCLLTPGKWVLASLPYTLFGLFLIRHAQMPQQLLCVPFFALGICVFRMGRPVSVAKAANLLGLWACAMIAFTYWGQRGHPHFTFQLLLLGVLLMGLAWLSRQKTLPRGLAVWDRRLGALSYPLYIGHGLILTALLNLTAQRGWALYAAGMLGSLLLAIVLAETVDRPMRRLRTRLRGIAI